MSPKHSREDYPANVDDPEEAYPYVPNEGTEAYYGSYSVDVEDVEPENRRAYVSVRSPSVPWEGYVPLYHLADEEHDLESYPWEDDGGSSGTTDDDEDDE